MTENDDSVGSDAFQGQRAEPLIHYQSSDMQKFHLSRSPSMALGNGIELKNHEELLFLAYLAKKTENYEDMRIFMRKVALSKPELSKEEKSMLTVAYKNVVGKLRLSWKTLWNGLFDEEAGQAKRLEKMEFASIFDLSPSDLDKSPLSGMSDRRDVKETSTQEMELKNASETISQSDVRRKNSAQNLDVPSNYLNLPMTKLIHDVRQELQDVCFDFIELIQDHLLPNCLESDYESIVLYNKLLGDYYRYLTERTPDRAARAGYIQEARQFYDVALACCEEHIPVTDQLRLGLALNISVFRFEIMNKPDQACELAKSTHDAAIAALEGEDEAESKDLTMLLDVLRENLNIWTSDDASQR